MFAGVPTIVGTTSSHTSTLSESLSSSSVAATPSPGVPEPSPSIKSSAGLSAAPPASFAMSVSACESLSSLVRSIPSPSKALAISAMFIISQAAKPEVKAIITCTSAVPPAGIVCVIVVVTSPVVPLQMLLTGLPVNSNPSGMYSTISIF